jgi:hypothetical protein
MFFTFEKRFKLDSCVCTKNWERLLSEPGWFSTQPAFSVDADVVQALATRGEQPNRSSA